MKTKFTLLYFTLALCVATPIISRAQVNVQDSLALVDLYNSTDGRHWISSYQWLSLNPVSTWEGIAVKDSRVSSIGLLENNLNGNIPASIGSLEKLEYLNLAENTLIGTIPSELGNLINVNYFYLDQNSLTGSIPSELGNLKNVLQLYLYNNQLTGSIPTDLGKLTTLESLFLNNNLLTGNIPRELGNLINLIDLRLRYNQLSGKIPSELGNFPNLLFMELNDNQLTGGIPNSFSNLKNLKSLILTNNKLSGRIPSIIGKLTNLYSLYLDRNRFSGTIPSTITTLPLTSLFLSYDNFTFNGMEEVVRKFPFTVYLDQSRIPIHQNGTSLYVSAGGTLSNNTYRWYKKGEAGYTQTIGDSVFHPATSGTYFARVSNSICTKLILKSDSIVYTAPSPLNGNIASSTNNLQGSDKTNSFSIYPNPAKDMLHVQANCNASFSLVNDEGKILLTKNINGKGNINVSGLAAGLYYLKNNSSGAVQKVIISR